MSTPTPDFASKGRLTREERKLQLDQMRVRQDGWQHILTTYIDAMFSKQGIAGSPSVMMEKMIDQILATGRPASHEEFKQKLEQLKSHPEGWRLIRSTYIQTMLFKQGIAGTPGVMMDDMIEEIVDAEYPSVN